MRQHGIRVLVAVAVAFGGVTGRGLGQEAAGEVPVGLVPEPVAVVAPAAPAVPARAVADPVEVAADALVVRPVGLASTVVGAAIYVVALPFAAIAGDVKGMGRSLVGSPARFTFKRRLGDFESRPL
jgi:hypothetical protein